MKPPKPIPTQCRTCSGIGRHTLTCQESTGLRHADRTWQCQGCLTHGNGGWLLVAGVKRCVGCAATAAILAADDGAAS